MYAACIYRNSIGQFYITVPETAINDSCNSPLCMPLLFRNYFTYLIISLCTKTQWNLATLAAKLGPEM